MDPREHDQGGVWGLDLPKCDAIDCDAFADWVYIGEGGDLYLCVIHGGREPVKDWLWIGE